MNFDKIENMSSLHAHSPLKQLSVPLHFKAQIIGILIAHYKTKTLKISVFFHGKSIAFPTLFEGIFKVKSKDIFMAFFTMKLPWKKH